MGVFERRSAYGGCFLKRSLASRFPNRSYDWKWHFQSLITDCFMALRRKM
jgi:hypothetical protein